jgi:VanZ family protein
MKKQSKFYEILEDYFPLVLLSVYIFVQSSRPAIAVSFNGPFNYFLHKVAHVIVYSFLYLFAIRGFKDRKNALVYCVLFAISDEFHQYFTPTRNASVIDILIDTTGILSTNYLVETYHSKIPAVLKNFFSL